MSIIKIASPAPAIPVAAPSNGGGYAGIFLAILLIGGAYLGWQYFSRDKSEEEHKQAA